jgi:hypothetical protein
MDVLRTMKIQTAQTRMRSFERASVHFVSYLVLASYCHVFHLPYVEVDNVSRKNGGKIEARGIINERRENYPVFISVFGASINAVCLGLCIPHFDTAPPHCLILECNGECHTCVVAEACAAEPIVLLRI